MKKKHPRLPNGFGSIRYLGKNRTNPYAVHPPSKEVDEKGNPRLPRALCYVSDWYTGFAVLNAYHSGKYQPGDELAIAELKDAPETENALVKFILSDFTARQSASKRSRGMTFSEVYEAFYKHKFEESKKEYSTSSERAIRNAFSNSSALHDRNYASLNTIDYQRVIDSCPLRYASLENIKNLFRQMTTYAMDAGIIEKDVTKNVKINIPDDDEHGVPFSDEELRVLWEHRNDNETAEMLVIMCFSGFRISEYKTLTVNLDEGYFQGGLKTAAGKNRIVPIHSAIRPLVERRMKRDGAILYPSISAFRRSIEAVCKSFELSDHTPHDCRHTFSALCERYEVREADRARMLGHSLKDITNRVYGHRTLLDLQNEIEKIKPGFVTNV